ncbi:hypothetical protein M3Y99_01022700 [Aphelenchoides fujianensis]|nr:hypothetical protein M3Y99_01022700 [Aphelenchoides fujianensis]
MLRPCALSRAALYQQLMEQECYLQCHPGDCQKAQQKKADRARRKSRARRNRARKTKGKGRSRKSKPSAKKNKKKH